MNSPKSSTLLTTLLWLWERRGELEGDGGVVLFEEDEKLRCEASELWRDKFDEGVDHPPKAESGEGGILGKERFMGGCCWCWRIIVLPTPEEFETKPVAPAEPRPCPGPCTPLDPLTLTLLLLLLLLLRWWGVRTGFLVPLWLRVKALLFGALASLRLKLAFPFPFSLEGGRETGRGGAGGDSSPGGIWALEMFPFWWDETSEGFFPTQFPLFNNLSPDPESGGQSPLLFFVELGSKALQDLGDENSTSSSILSSGSSYKGVMVLVKVREGWDETRGSWLQDNRNLCEQGKWIGVEDSW